MAIAVVSGVVHLQTGERLGYGSPYPEGIAVGHINQTGDATGGDITFAFNADGGFIYRFEGLQVARGAATNHQGDVLTSHIWAEQKSGLGTSAFQLNWILTYGRASFDVFMLGMPRGSGSTTPGEGSMALLQQLRRLPMGRLEKVASQVLLQINGSGWNDDTITHEASVWFTYWRKEAFALPGFLSSFYEAPEVPPLLPPR